MFDKELMKQLATIPAESRAEWIAERKKLEALAGETTRLNVEEMIPKYGIARVLRVLAANWIPPIRAGRNAELWFCSTIHQAYIQDLFRQYANLRKL